MKMNRITLTTIAAGAAAVMLLASCQRDELRGGALEGEERAVTVTALIPSDPVAVRSAETPGDGTLANRCLMQVYVVDDPQAPVAYGEPQETAVTSLSATFEARLMSGHAYRLVFWADCATAPAAEGGEYKDKYYDTREFPSKVSLKTTAFRGNQNELDAFFGEASVTAEQLAAGPVSVTADLTRPFGQLNIYATDYAQIPVESMKPAAVNIAFTSIYTSIDLTTGELSGLEQVTYAAAVTPHDAATGHLTFDYLLATGEEDAIADFTMNFYTSADATAEAAEPYTFSSIPVRRNYITNVRGNLLTDRTAVTVDVVPAFSNAADNPIEINLVEAGSTVNMPDEDIVVNIPEGTLTSAEEYSISAKSVVLVGEGADAGDNIMESVRMNITAEEGVTVRNLAFTGTRPAGDGNAAVSISTPGDVLIEGIEWSRDAYNPIEINLGSSNEPAGNVTVRGCDFQTAVSNNCISVFGMSEGGVVNIENCTFAKANNALRMSNRTNAENVVLNITDCTYEETTDDAYAGFLLFQDYTSADPLTAKAFSTWTVNFTNLVGPEGTKITEDYESQVWYMYYDNGGGLVNDETQFPVINYK